MDFDELLELIHILYNNLKDHPYKTKWHSATPMDNGTIAIGYTQYEPWLWNEIFAIHYLLCGYMGGKSEHYQEPNLKNYEVISHANLDELTDWNMHHPRPGRLEDDSEYTWHQF
ncbi:hypothetical protein KFR76_00295 [Corynebacterium diphtheriae]|nr:hypothetical protein KFR76_00295 [Corynebacterium diphtheriae]